MKWILVFWIIHPHYMEVKYIKDFPSVESCREAGTLIENVKYKINFHCGME
jgi:hypothetical protein